VITKIVLVKVTLVKFIQSGSHLACLVSLTVGEKTAKKAGKVSEQNCAANVVVNVRLLQWVLLLR